MSSDPVYFATAAAFRRWLARNGVTASEIAVGFMKRATGVKSITWPEAVDEALCVGWIDGLRHRVDECRYRIRFTPRRSGSHWSAVNIARFSALKAEGRVKPAGLLAFERRTEARSRRASYEQTSVPELAPSEMEYLRQNQPAWSFFEAQPPGYRKKAIWWVVGARKDATRQRRFASLCRACLAGRRL